MSAGAEAEDIAKRLMDYGFHAPTLSFPVWLEDTGTDLNQNQNVALDCFDAIDWYS
jgi:glycine cleavage system protein P-like pyridoxal-binding family